MDQEPNCKLILQEGPLPAEEFELAADEVIIGRAPYVDIVIVHASVSGRHVLILHENGQFILEDLQSTNGTFLNGKRVTGREVLNPGSEIRLGQTIFLHFEVAAVKRASPENTVLLEEDISLNPKPEKEMPPTDPESAGVSNQVFVEEPESTVANGDVAKSDQVGGDKLFVGDVSERSVVAVGAGASATAIYQGLSTEEVAELVAELKKKDQPIVWDGRTPYLGLTTFRESDAQFFFGRENLVDDLLDRIEETAFIVIAGPSGSGKSSVARAGLLNALRNGRLARSDTWLLGAMLPSGDPIGKLAEAVDQLAKSPQAGNIIRQEGMTNPLALSRQLETLLTDDPNQRCILLIDQFEETFSQTKDEHVRAAFINLLTASAQAEGKRTSIVVSLRSDFVSHCAHYPQLRTLMSQQFQLVGAMDPQDLAKAITLPALEVGVEIDPALVSRIVTDMKGEPGALPLMSFALRDLFDAQKTNKGMPMALTLPGYLARGGIESALERHANRVFDNFSDMQKALAKSIFSKLIEVGQGRLVTRRTATLRELVPAGASAQETIVVVWVLAQQGTRLVTTGGVDSNQSEGQETTAQTIVTLAHEKLIDAWPWLRNLVDENREIIALQNQISRDARAWRKDVRSTHTLIGASLNEAVARGEQEDAGFLYRGGRLLQVEEKLELLQPDLDDLSQRFIEASMIQRERRKSEREQQRQAREQLRQRITGAAVAGLVITLVLAVLALLQWQQAAQGRQTALKAQATAAAERDLAQLALSRQLAAVTMTQLENKPDLALLLSLEANQIAHTVEARRALRAGLALNSRLSTYIHGHNDFVTSAAFSPDGRTLASGSNDNSILLWDASTGQSLGPPLNGHTDNVLSIAFSPNGQIIASGSGDKTIMLWDAASGQPLGLPLTGHSDWVRSVAFSPDGQTLASSGDETIILWDLTNSPPLSSTLTGHTDVVRSVTFSPDGQTLASGSSDETIILWDVTDGKPRSPALDDHADSVRSVAFSPNGQNLASASENGTIILWDMDGGPSIGRTLKGHTNSVRSVAFSPYRSEDTTDYILASGDTDGNIMLWDTVTGQALGPPLTGHTDWVRSVDFSPDGQTLASASHDLTIILWDITNQELDTLAVDPPLTNHMDSVQSVAFSPDGKTLASGSNDNTIIIWDVATGQPLRPPLTGHKDGIKSVTFSPDGQTLASGSIDESIILWDVASGEPLGLPLTGHTESVQSVAFSPDGQTLASGSNDETIILWDVASGEPLGTPITGHTKGVQSVAFNPDGQILASAGDDKAIILWNITGSPTLSATLTGHKDVVFSIAFSPDGQTLASGSWDKTIILWDVDKGQPLGLPMTGHTESVQSVAISPDGQTLASGSWDETIILWDALTGHPLTVNPPLNGPTGSVRSVTFSPDGQIMASASDDGTILLWDVSLESWQDRACQRANRNLSRQEWQQFFGEQSYRATCPDLPVPTD